MKETKNLGPGSEIHFMELGGYLGGGVKAQGEEKSKGRDMSSTLPLRGKVFLCTCSCTSDDGTVCL